MCDYKNIYKYDNENFKGECIAYSIIGYNFLKSNEILKNVIENLSVKKYKINFDDKEEGYDDYHYFMEFKYNNKNYIVDNTWYYLKNEYKQKYKPKNIIKLKVKEINELLKTINENDEDDENDENDENSVFNILIINDIIRHFNNNFE
jgi:hypothetical protein